MARPIVNPQYVVLFHHFRNLLEKAAEREIDVAPLKGAHLLTGIYPQGEDRGTLADVDFLVHPEAWESCLALLQEMGFVESMMVTNRPVSCRGFYEASFAFRLGDGRQIRFEPHRYLVQTDRLNIDYEALWSRSRPGQFDGAPCRRLSNTDHFLHGVVHLITHSFISPERSLRDLELLVIRGGVSLDQVVPEIRKWRIERGAWLALTLLKARTPGLAAKRQIDAISPPFWVQRCLGYLVPDSSGFRFPKMGLRAQQIVLWPLLFDNFLSYITYAGRYAVLRAQDFVEHYSEAPRR